MVADGLTGTAVLLGAPTVAVSTAVAAAGVAVLATALVGFARACAVWVPANALLIMLLGKAVDGVGNGMLLVTLGVATGLREADFEQAETEVITITPIKKITHTRFFIN